MVRPLPAESRPIRAAKNLNTMPVTEDSPVGDGTWIQTSEELSDSNEDITIDPHILNNMLLSTSLNTSATETMIRSEQAHAKLNIPVSVIEPKRKAEEIHHILEPAAETNVHVKGAESMEKKSPEATQDSACPSSTDEVDRLYFVDCRGSLEFEDALSKKNDKDSTNFQKPGTNSNASSKLNAEHKRQDVSKGNGKIATVFQEPAVNYFASDYQYPEGVQRNVAAQGRDLYLRFLHEQMRAVRVPEPPSMDPWRAARLDLDYSVSLNASMRNRRSLRQMADTFASSEHRKKVQEQAALVDLESLNLTSFSELLHSLFQEGGITSERIIVLFFFCVDLTIRALTEQLLGCFHQLIEWSQIYIVDTVSVWVQQSGGWSAVLEQSSDYIYKAAKIALVCATIAALFMYIRRAR